MPLPSFSSRQLPVVVCVVAVAVTVVVTVVATRNRTRKTEKIAKHLTHDQRNNKQTDKQQQEEERQEEDEEEVVAQHPIREILGVQPGQEQQQEQQQQQQRILTRGSITIVHGSVTGTCAKFATSLANRIRQEVDVKQLRTRTIQVASTRDFDWWDELINDDDGDGSGDGTSSTSSGDGRAATTTTATSTTTTPALLIILLSTYTEGSWPPAAESLLTALQDLLNDWRIAKFPLKEKLQVAVFGTGSSEYDTSTIGQPAKQCKHYFQRLGAKCINFPIALTIGDDAVANHAQDTFDQWQQVLLSRILKQPQVENGSKCKPNGDSCCQESKGKAKTSHTNNKNNHNDQCNGGNDYDDDNDDHSDDDDDDQDNREPEVMDLEDMGDSILASTSSTNDNNNNATPREMVTPTQAAALKKEGYRLIGSHSAVKLCRWTKHQLRGRGGCYKHTFYGITSYQCMEATPSLACANKCVFCWRHHKNPVGKEWRWKTDDPHFIVDQAVKTHIQMIKEAKGIPGVQMDRWKEAHTVRHCALSLVGEPIMYPRIDELLHDLHTRRISTFLVTNGQHPQAIAELRPVTQLYVSVDAPTKESLIAIDRPLFSDAWDRLKQSLALLSENKPYQRTVARLTVVKGWNSDEIEGYAQLIALGKVSLVEVKGVTFCGKSDASNLNMTNTPWHHEVVELAQTLKREIDKIRTNQSKNNNNNNDIPPEYDLACEHKHSCSVLLARVDQFAVDDATATRTAAGTSSTTSTRRWKTWIDYDKFHELAARHASDPSFSYTVQDYTADTPSWALFGSEEEGFDPTDSRHRKKSKHPKYLQFDESGVPTHDHNNQKLEESERHRLRLLMEERKRQIGCSSVDGGDGGGSVVTSVKGDGAREVLDASLMFRGLVVTK